MIIGTGVDLDIETVAMPLCEQSRGSDGAGSARAPRSLVLDVRLHSVVESICDRLAGACASAAHFAIGRGRAHAVATVPLEARRP